MQLPEFIIAKSYDLQNNVCYVDGVIQSSTQPCNEGLKNIFGILGAIFIPLIIIGLALFILWIITFIHVIKNPDVDNRTIWLVAHIVSIFVGAAWIVSPIYFFAVQRPYNKAHRSLVSAPDKNTNYSPPMPVQNPNPSYPPTGNNMPTNVAPPAAPTQPENQNQPPIV